MSPRRARRDAPRSSTPYTRSLLAAANCFTCGTSHSMLPLSASMQCNIGSSDVTNTRSPTAARGRVTGKPVAYFQRRSPVISCIANTSPSKSRDVHVRLPIRRRRHDLAPGLQPETHPQIVAAAHVEVTTVGRPNETLRRHQRRHHRPAKRLVVPRRQLLRRPADSLQYDRGRAGRTRTSRHTPARLPVRRRPGG